ncbi:C-type lectin domain family 4 member G isoform X1 [Sarcophilus harrisii]|uniref:C-type lectin domain-containing protein n=1 Tax=Sarcophilus harrisii TaxID=9305 RepID=G3VW32_SARHA|nr:C-type lectin domain family 4 member G isoform X1 [Sarcophilus harrisii]
MESIQYNRWETSEEFEMADTKRQWRPWEAGWWAKQLPGGRPAFPLYLLFSVTSFLWIILLSMLLSKVMELSREIENLDEQLERIQVNGSKNSEKLVALQVDLNSSDSKHQTLKAKAETMAETLRNLQESQASLSTTLSQELAEAREDRENIRSEMFRGLEAVRSENGSFCQPCPSPWKAFQGSCYFFSKIKLTWSKARDDCIQKKAHLVIINNRDEQNFLTPTERLGFWIGLRKVKEGIHKWIDGTSLGYTNWNEGEPNDSQGRENCVMMLHHGKWNDFTCEVSSDNWICEKRQTC